MACMVGGLAVGDCCFNVRLMYVIGTDGAGKTTMAQRIVSEYSKALRVRYVYCQHRPFLLWLLKLPARLLFMRQADQFKNYDRYKARKDAVIRRRPWLTRLYALVWYFDAGLQTWPRLVWARWTSDVVLLDRYYLDWVVNLGVLGRNSLDAMLCDARWLERFLPRANLVVFLNVSEETAFARKKDIQSVQYLRERKERYLQLAPHYQFQVVDANQDAETVFQQVRALVEAAASSRACAAAVPTSS
jgi:thymidylate kinase